MGGLNQDKSLAVQHLTDVTRFLPLSAVHENGILFNEIMGDIAKKCYQIFSFQLHAQWRLVPIHFSYENTVICISTGFYTFVCLRILQGSHGVGYNCLCPN